MTSQRVLRRSVRVKRGSRHAFFVPEHFGCDSTGSWSGEHAFKLADEAARTIGIVDASRGKVHLVGHSYGGAVALRAAVERPERIASLTLYEPGVSSVEDDGRKRSTRARGNHRDFEAHRRWRELWRLSRRGGFVR